MSDAKTNIDDSRSIRQDNLLDTLPVYIATSIFLLTIVLATIQVLLRLLPIEIGFLFWTEPLARYLLIVMTYLGTSVAVRNDENVKIDLLKRWFQKNRPSMYHVVTVLIGLCVLFFVYATFQGSLSSAQDSWDSGTHLPHVTYGMIHGTIVVSVSLMGLYTLYDLAPYAKFVAAKITGGNYQLPMSSPGSVADEATAQLDEEKASERAEDIMGLSGSDSEDDADGAESEIDAHDGSKRVIDDE